MAKHPRERRRTDAGRIGDAGTGKLDQDTTTPPPRPKARANPAKPDADDAAARERLVRDRNAAIDQLKRLGLMREADPRTGRGAETVLDEGDEAQASERVDMSFTHRQRLGDRINQLTRALERLTRGTYGRCEACGEPIGLARLRAIPEVSTCRDCQERLEREAA